MSNLSIPTVTVQPGQLLTSLTQAQLCQFTSAMIDKGARLVRDQQRADTYYLSANLQLSAGMAARESYVRIDRMIVEATLNALALGTALSKAVLDRQIMPMLLDTGRYTQGAAMFVRLLLAATDDSRQIRLNGVRITVTQVARDGFLQMVRSFWARLGATARWGVGDPARFFLKG